MQAARGGAGRPGRGPERERERPPGAGAESPCAAPGQPAGGAAMHPGPPGAALRLWLGYVCLALVQAGKGARRAGRRRGGLLSCGSQGSPQVPSLLPGGPDSAPLTALPIPRSLFPTCLTPRALPATPALGLVL